MSRPWKRFCQKAVVLAALVGSLAAWSAAPPASAAGAVGSAPQPTFATSASWGPNGTVIEVHSVTPCVAPAGATGWHVEVSFAYQPVSDTESDQLAGASVAADGSWTTSLTVNGATGQATVGAQCEGSHATSFAYASKAFEVTTSDRGYWMVTKKPFSSGGFLAYGPGSEINVAPFGDAPDLDYGPLPPGAAPPAGMAPDPVTGDGYWLVGTDGGVFSFGDARFYGSAATLRLAAPAVGMTATADGHGYWLGAADGGVFTFGDGQFYGSCTNWCGAGTPVGIVATPATSAG